MVIILIFASVVGFIMALAIGANDVANSMATAVGAKAITIKQAVIIAAVLEFAGALFFGRMVSKTIAKGIVPLESMYSNEMIIAGALSALIGATLWIIVATKFELPVSTTHSIVGGMAGFGIIAIGMNAVNWVKMGLIAASWLISPFLGGLLAFLLFKLISKLILKKVNPFVCTKKVGPFLVGATLFIVSWLFFGKTMHWSLQKSLLFSSISFVITTSISYFLFRYIKRETDEKASVEKIFKKLQILTSCYMAIAHGANDVANAVGPLAVIFIVAKTLDIEKAVNAPVPKEILFIGGIGISIGVAVWGYKIMRTIGEKITELNNSRGFTIDFSTATTVMFASTLGLPVSTTHTVVGSVIGVGYARGIGAVNFGIVKQIIFSWIITVPAAAITSALLYKFVLFKLVTIILRG